MGVSMGKPTECKWCGEGHAVSSVSFVRFKCRSSYWVNSGDWDMSWRCAYSAANQVQQQRGRIQQAIDTLKNATRYRVTPVSRRTIEWEETVDGIVTDSAAVDEALAILEGERE